MIWGKAAGWIVKTAHWRNNHSRMRSPLVSMAGQQALSTKGECYAFNQFDYYSGRCWRDPLDD